ncbi:MAG: MFS transporter [Candidatus Geothermarchaeales archaeon]
MRRTATLLSLGVAQYLLMISWFNLSAVLPIIYVDWDLTGSLAGVMLAAGEVGYLIGSMLMGYLTDRIGGFKTFTLGSIGAGLSGVAFALYAHNFASALILRLLVGLGLSGTYIPGMKIVSDIYSHEKMGKVIGVYTASFTAGVSSSYYITSVFASLYGWRGGIFWTSVWSLLAAAIACLSSRGYEARVVFKGWVGWGALMRNVLAKRSVWLISLGYMGHVWELQGMRSWLGPYLNASIRTLGHSAGEAFTLGNQVSSAILIVGLVMPGIGGWLSDRVGRRRSIVFIATMSILFSLTFGWMIRSPLYLLVAIGLAYSLAIIADSAIYKAGLIEIVKEEFTGVALGFQSLLGFMGSTLSVAFFGAILDLTNNPSDVAGLGYFPIWGWSYTTLGLVSLISPLSALLLKREPKGVKLSS